MNAAGKTKLVSAIILIVLLSLFAYFVLASDAPSNVQAVLIDNNISNLRVRVTWTASDLGNLTGYNVSNSSLTTLPVYTNTTLGPTELEYTYTNLQAGKTYFYYVAAGNVSGAKAVSATKNITLPIFYNVSINATPAPAFIINRTNNVIYFNFAANNSGASELHFYYNISYNGQNTSEHDYTCLPSEELYVCNISYAADDLNFNLQRDGTVTVSGYLYAGDSPDTYSRTSVQTFSGITPNAEPTLVNNLVTITNGTQSGLPILNCLFNMTDADGDVLNNSMANITWYIKNEGLNDFVQVLGQNSSTLPYPIFNDDDVIICSVRPHDGYDYSIIAYNSSAFVFNRNLRPTLYFINSSTTLSSPARVGQSITFTGQAYDQDVGGGQLNITFCRDEFNVETNYGENANITIGTAVGTNGTILWLFSNTSGIPVQEIQITPNAISNGPFSPPLYDFYAYEVSNFSEIPANPLSFAFADHDNILVQNITNRFRLEDNPIVAANKFMVIKMCIDSNNDGICDSANSGTYSFTIAVRSNATYKIATSNLANASSDTGVVLNDSRFVSDNAKIVYGADGGSNCGSKMLCSQVGNAGATLVTLSCQYTAAEDDNAAQTYSGYARDPSGNISRVRIDSFYVNHAPHVANLEVFKQVASTDVTTFVPADGGARSNESLYCNFTITDADSYSSWKSNSTNYTVKWFYKTATAGNFSSCAVCNMQNNKVLPHGNTNAGDTWFCQVTPQDGFMNGTAINSSQVIITASDANDTTNRPIVDSTDDNSNSINQSLYVSTNVSVTTTWHDVNSNQFYVYACEGNYTDAGDDFAGTGCLNEEYYRSSLLIGALGDNSHSFAFTIPPLVRGPNNYTIFVCDTDGLCSYGSQNSSSSFWVETLRENISVLVVNSTSESFGDYADVDENLFCNFSYDDSSNGERYTQENLTGLLANDTITLSWYKNTSFNTYVKVFENISNISNTQTNHGDKWFCQIRFNAPIQQETNSTKLLIKDSSIASSSAPVITSFFRPSAAAKANVGESTTLKIQWTDNESNSVTAYVCNSSAITVTGCVAKTINYSENNMFGADIDIPYTPTNEDPYNFTVYAKLCDSTYNCSAVVNTTFAINFRPTVENVTITRQVVLGQLTLACDYDYKSNEKPNAYPSDEKTPSQSIYNWYLMTGAGGATLVKTATGDNSFAPSISQIGFTYCEVKVKDALNLEDTAFRRSDNTESTINSQYTITVANTIPGLINTTTTPIIGLLSSSSNDTTVLSYVFRDLANFTTTTTQSFENISVPEYAAIQKQIGVYSNQSLIYLNKGVLTAAMVNTSLPSVPHFIKFMGHNRTDFTFYNYTFYLETPQYLVLNLTTPLEHPVNVGELVEFYYYEKPTGWFNISLDLYGDYNNSFQLMSADGGVYTYSGKIFSDITAPNFTINSSNENQSLLAYEGNIKVIIEDAVSLNWSTLNITLSNGTHVQRFNYSGSLTENNLTNITISDDYTFSATQKEGIAYFWLPTNLSTGTYEVNVSVKDLAGNYNFTNGTTFLFNASSIGLNNLTIVDNESLSDEELRAGGVNISFTHNASDIIRFYVYEVYKNISGNLALIQRNSTNTFANVTIATGNLTNNTCIVAAGYIITEYAVPSNISVSKCLQYYDSNYPSITINSTQFDGTNFYANDALNISAIVRNANLTAYTIRNDTNQIETGPVTNNIGVGNFSRYDTKINLPWAQNFRRNITINASSVAGYNATKSYYIYTDRVYPRYANMSTNGTYNNTDNITVWILARDENYIRTVEVIDTINGSLVVRGSAMPNGTVTVSGLQYVNYTYKLNNSLLVSNSTFDVYFNISDYANNVNQSSNFTLSLLNRAPVNHTRIPDVYWNKSADPTTLNLSLYFSDPDGDNFTFTNSTPLFSNLLLSEQGLLTGRFTEANASTVNLTLFLQDIKQKNGSYNMTFYVLEGNCTNQQNAVFVGFAQTCNSTVTQTVTPPTPGGGSGGGGSGGGGGGGGSGIVGIAGPSTTTRTYFREAFYNLPANTKKTFGMGETDLYVIYVSFSYPVDLPYGVFENQNLQTISVPQPGEQVYGYFELKTTYFDSTKAKDIQIKFRVRKNNTIGLGKDNVEILRWTTQWDTHAARYTSEDANYYYYSTSLPGFSNFAIVKKEQAVIPPIEDIIPITTPPVTQPEPTIEYPETPVSSPSWWIWVIVMAAILIIAFGGMYFVRRPRQETVLAPNERPMEVDPLPQYIENQLKKGIIPEEIKAALVKAGWPEKEVDEALSRARKKKIDMTLIDMNLVKQIQMLDRKEYTEKEIERELQGQHIPDAVIHTNIHYFEAIKKLEKQVAEWIRSGYSKEHIEQHLVHLNWPVIIIYEIMKKY